MLSPECTQVLPGSGNLTGGGLISNNEQFEYFSVTSDQRRMGTTFWSEWERQQERRRRLAHTAAELNAQLRIRAEASVHDATL